MIFLLLAVFLIAAAIAAVYEYAALRHHPWPTITAEVRRGERRFPVLYAPVFFAVGLLLGHFWQ